MPKETKKNARKARDSGICTRWTVKRKGKRKGDPLSSLMTRLGMEEKRKSWKRRLNLI